MLSRNITERRHRRQIRQLILHLEQTILLLLLLPDVPRLHRPPTSDVGATRRLAVRRGAGDATVRRGKVHRTATTALAALETAGTRFRQAGRDVRAGGRRRAASTAARPLFHISTFVTDHIGQAAGQRGRAFGRRGGGHVCRGRAAVRGRRMELLYGRASVVRELLPANEHGSAAAKPKDTARCNMARKDRDSIDGI